MITKELIRKGIESKVIRFKSDPDGIDGRGTVCAIGEYWFYFGGLTAEELTPDEYQENVPMEEIIDEIFDVLEDFRNTDGFEDEYEYYQRLLNEKCREPRAPVESAPRPVEYIEKAAAIAEAERYGLTNGSAIGRHGGIADIIAEALAAIPAADVAPVQRGSWVDADISGVQHYRCTACGEYIEATWMANFDYRFCPNCGAQMDEGIEMT